MLLIFFNKKLLNCGKNSCENGVGGNTCAPSGMGLGTIFDPTRRSGLERR